MNRGKHAKNRNKRHVNMSLKSIYFPPFWTV
jgi:hypothetical protein